MTPSARPADAASARASLHVSVVAFRPDRPTLEATLRSLVAAVAYARAAGAVGDVALSLIDNAPDGEERGLRALVTAAVEGAGIALAYLAGHGNVGYGRGHNLALRTARADFHLVLNPDVLLAEDALVHAVQFMREHPHVGLLSPYVAGESGGREFLCKRYPSVLVLLLRGFAPAALQRPFRRLLDTYEMRDVPADATLLDPPIVSGCFMFLRHGGRPPGGGFSDSYFLYFEDFDYSLRVAREARLAYVPSVRITHFGGQAARKGMRHTRMFARSALTFFRQHGWRWA